jgi:hypothetical protein
VEPGSFTGIVWPCAFFLTLLNELGLLCMMVGKKNDWSAMPLPLQFRTVNNAPI